jgi:hypothetical protein
VVLLARLLELVVLVLELGREQLLLLWFLVLVWLLCQEQVLQLAALPLLPQTLVQELAPEVLLAPAV